MNNRSLYSWWQARPGLGLSDLITRENSPLFSAAAHVRRLADCQLCHGPNSWLGWWKWNSFLIRGAGGARAGDFAWLGYPTASLVFNI